MFVGTSANRKSTPPHQQDPSTIFFHTRQEEEGNSLGGPEIYAVANKLFTAGPAGNSTVKTLFIRLDASGLFKRRS